MATGKLTALAVDRAHREGQPVMLCDGGGLYFRKQTREGAAWTLRYRFAGRARWMTLGNYEPAEYRSRLENADEVANAARLAVAGELQRIFRTGKLLSGGAVKLDASGTTGFLARPRRRSA
jgi:hypothetical protein